MRRRLAIALTVMAATACSTAVPAPRVAPADPTGPVTAAPPTVPEGWLGGFREVDIDAPPSLVMEIVSDPEAYRKTLPFVRSLEVTGQGPQGDALIAIDQGTSLVHGRYTAHLLRERADRVRIWLDASLPHDIDGADGFMEVRPRPGGGSRLTFFLAFDLGGTVRFLFGAKIQRSAMSTPERIRALAEARARTTASP